MKILFAPMEGIAHWLYRSAQHACFDGADEYFLPFWSPRGQSLTHREQADALPEKQSAVLGGFVDVLAGFRLGLVDEADVTAVVNQRVEELTQAEENGTRLPGPDLQGDE